MKRKAPPTPGLRARKRAETRARIIEGALKLFVKRGFDGTTLDDIADAAGISRRTFFHYFESKEDLAFAWLDSSTDDIVAAAKRERADQPLLAIAANAIAACVSPYGRDEAFALARLVNETPGLARPQPDEIRRLEAALAEVIAARKGLKKDDLRARLAAMTAVGAMRIASQRWYENGGKEDMAAFSRRIVKALAAALAE
ncbi:MAG: TetR family transcriptional regulator [Rhizomicrobium sp.]